MLLAALLAALPLPLEPGRFWEYAESVTEKVGQLYETTENVARFEVRGTPGHPYLKQTEGGDVDGGPVEHGQGWLRLGSFTGDDPLPLPLEVGRSGPRGESGGVPWSVESEEDVVTPAGTFRALRCALRTWHSESILWIAPGVGIVKESQGVPGEPPEILRVLVRSGVP